MPNSSLRRSMYGGLLSLSLAAEDIHAAARKGDLATIRTLVGREPALLKARDRAGSTPLHLAAREGRPEVLTFLIAQGAELDARDSQSATALHEAATANRGNVVTRLLEQGALAEALDYKQRTPLHRAALAGARDAVAALLKGGASLEPGDAWGRTPLVLGVRERCGPEVVRMLLQARADVSSKDKFGSDALELAAWRGSSDVVDLLLDHKAAVPPPGPAATRLLNLSGTGGLTRLFRVLAARGVELTRKNSSDGTWSEPQNLGDVINTPGLNFCPSVSPDGKYLFYTMNRDLYWVSTLILDPLKARAQK